MICRLLRLFVGLVGSSFFDEMPNSEMCSCLVLINFSDNIEAGCWTKTYIEVQVAVIFQPND